MEVDLLPVANQAAHPAATPAEREEARQELLKREIEELKVRLREQEYEIHSAEKRTEELNNQLAAAKADASNNNIAQLKAQAHIAQRELTRERQERRADAFAAASRLSRLEKELSAASAEVPEVSPEAVPAHHGRLRKILLGMAAVTVLGSIISLAAFHPQFIPEAEAHNDAPTIAQETPPAEPAGASQLSQALDHLNRALSAFAGVDAGELLRAASRLQIGKGCSAFDWNNGHPALVFRTGSSMESLPSAIEGCAEAVEKLH